MKAILACTKSGGIGKDGAMPWPFDEKDLARFKKLTLNSTIIMGRGTWESKGMPKPLPKRQNIVVSTQELTLPEGVIRLDNINHKTLVEDLKVDWCIGGAGLFNSLFELFDEIHLSHLHKEYECDTNIDLERIKEHFYIKSSAMSLTHNYEIWKRQ